MYTFVTGGAGFIGSHLCRRLQAQGHPVLIFDNFDPYYDPAIKRGNIAGLTDNVTLIEGDLRDKVLIDQLFQQYPIRRVAHLGGLSGVRYSTENGALYAEVNTQGSVHLLDAARRHNVEIFVQISTSSVYGNTTRVPFNEEDAADHPLSPYPASKRAAEIFGHSYHHLFGLNVTVLRLFNVYGPNGRPDMMPIKTMQALLADQPIQIYDDGLLKRDWTYVQDVVDGITAALDRPLGYGVFNLGYGSPVMLLDFIHIFEELTGKTAILNPVPAPASEPRITYCDNARARAALGFAPKVALPEGLRHTWEWFQRQHLVR
ncbi:MAG: GDP-mannose 4,6-dehydratase [bacterium]|nr:GDP-mannose 4,6-dehydratase [bacterium]